MTNGRDTTGGQAEHACIYCATEEGKCRRDGCETCCYCDRDLAPAGGCPLCGERGWNRTVCSKCGHVRDAPEIRANRFTTKSANHYPPPSPHTADQHGTGFRDLTDEQEDAMIDEVNAMGKPNPAMCSKCHDPSTPTCAAGGEHALYRLPVRAAPDALNKPKRARKPRKSTWKPNFPCGHHHRKPDCETCVALRRPASRPLAARLDEKTDKSRGPDGCWLWLGACDQNGRAQIYWDGRVQPASRAAWFIATGAEIPPSLYACHKCDNPKCVNPAHLFPGDASANQLDAVAKGRNNYVPRKKTLTDEERARIVVRFGEGVSFCKLAEEFGVSRRTVTHHLEAVGAYQRRSA